MIGKKRFGIIISAIIIVTAAALTPRAWRWGKNNLVDGVYIKNTSPIMGTYIAPALHSSANFTAINAATINWKTNGFWFDDEQLKQALKQSTFITVETESKNYTYGINDVLNEVLEGKFDSRIEKLAKLINQSKSTVLVSFDPVMEIPNNNASWALQAPQQYIRAFNYFAQKLKTAAPRVKIVWQPLGYPGDTEYWPGNSWVDAAAIDIGNVASYYTGKFSTDSTLEDQITHKLHRMRFVGKPVLLLGYDTTVTRQQVNQIAGKVKAYQQQYISTVYSAANFADTVAVKPYRKTLAIGVFDPQKKLVNQPFINTEHLFVNWAEIRSGAFKLSFDSVVNRGHNVIVTVEPWRDTQWPDDRNVLADVTSGRFDPLIKLLQATISNSPQKVYLRWAHEMEIPITRYLWQSQNPVQYIEAYRYFMHFFTAKNIYKVWGPAGDRGSVEWYPGNDVVDFVSIAIYGLPDKNITDFAKQESFETIFNRKLHRMRFIPKPIFITEFGVKGPEDFQRQWLQAAGKVIGRHHEVWGACYFNLYDNPKAWGENMEAPDWSISAATYRAFYQAASR